MKEKMSKLIEMIKENKVKAVVLSVAAVVTVTGAVAGACAIAKHQGGMDIAPATSEPSESEVATVTSSEASEPENTEEEVVSTASESVSAEDVIDTSTEKVSEVTETTPTVNSTTSKPKPVEVATVTSSETSLSTATATTPSAAALEYSGITVSEFEAVVENSKTCRYCGQSSNVCHRFGINMNCYDCGVSVEANTCHICE